ncbi:cache domain-containing sensor histidine kinase [Sporosarcina jiandibaonis]|uniref:cache domain-containing sensor histidine kinase n=1 Tax=Sporosarcina jiandibaonis TaxID=2715535 RepID=UPI0015519CB5|nr:sensor histidine kinase [Sporosarcina jiandibaonis]
MYRLIYRLNIQQRLLLYFSIVILVAITLITWVIYNHTANEIKEQSRVNLEYIVENASYQTDVFIQSMELATLPLLMNKEVKVFLDLSGDNRFDKYYYSKEIKKEMHQIMLKNQHINLIYLLAETGQYVLSSDNYIRGEDPLASKKFYNEIIRNTPDKGKISVLSIESTYNNENVISIARRVRGNLSFVPKGILGIEIDATSLEKLWNIAQFKNGTSLWIFDKDGRIVYHPDEDWLGKYIGEDFHSKFKDATANSIRDEWEGEEMGFYFNQSPETEWTLVAMQPTEVIYEPISGIRNTAIISFMTSLFIALLISIVFAKNIVSPLRKVQQGMKKLEVGEWEKIKPLKGTDEISSVVSSYNKMVNELSNLIDNLYESELKNKAVLLEKKNVELQALQLQINPHFLHNTLETISSYAVINDAEEISDMASALSKMFRYSLRNLEVVTVHSEIDHVKNFMIVMEHRFQKKLHVIYDIAPDALDAEVVKLSLQPIVENAIQHGLRKLRYEGSITIRAVKRNGLLVIQVIDNGSGISAERLIEIQAMLDKNEVRGNMGIGLSNVSRRIQLIFGEEYGLKLTSQPGGGTIVEMEIPIIEYDSLRAISV